MKTTIILIAAFALVLAATVAVPELTPRTGWQGMQADIPPGNVEVRPLPVVQNWLPGSGKNERMVTIPDGWSDERPLPAWNGNYGKDTSYAPNGDAPAGWLHPSVANPMTWMRR